jgi:hypothetical protein
MSTAIDEAEEREVKLVARRYERAGYRVTRPASSAGAPQFLEGFVPDLIAERDEDRVIVEVKRSNAVKGGNELKDIAERVAGIPGWRFELVVIAPAEDMASRRQPVLHSLSQQAQRYLEGNHPGPAYIVALHALHEALEIRAMPHDRHARDKAPPRLAHDLVVAGIISHAQYEQVRAALARGTQVLIAAEDVSLGDAKGVLRLAADIAGQIVPQVAA